MARPRKNGSTAVAENQATPSAEANGTAAVAKKSGGVKPGQKMVAVFDWSAKIADNSAEELTDTRPVVIGAAMLAFNDLNDDEKFALMLRSKKEQAKATRERKATETGEVPQSTVTNTQDEVEDSHELAGDEIPV